MRICKTDKLPELKADFSFFLFTALLFLICDSHCVLNVIIVCGMHEWGHLAAMAVFGVRIRKVHFSGFGIHIITRKSGAEPVMKSLAVLFAGPFANMLMYALLREKMPDTAIMSIGAGLYNLLPYSGLDGGAAAEMLITGNINERRLRTALRILRIMLVALSAVMVYIYGPEAVPLLTVVAVLYIKSEYLPCV